MHPVTASRQTFNPRGIMRPLILCGLITILLSACSAPLEPQRYSSEQTKNYYARLVDAYRSKGFLKTDASGEDAFINEDILTENFIQIALFSEYTVRRGRYVQSQVPSKIRKWIEPIRLEVSFGKTVPASQRRQDMKDIAQFVARLEQITGHPIEFSHSNPNLHILVINSDEQAIIGEELRARIPHLPKTVERAIAYSQLEIFCAAYTMSDSRRSYEYVEAIIHIKAEHPDIMRLSCIHEEIAQSMGLVNDSQYARPSIFNDDEEYALLTQHDELLLRILYDPRIKIGMSIEEARPIARQIASELMRERRANLAARGEANFGDPGA